MTPDLTEADRLAHDVAAALADIRRRHDDAIARVRAWDLREYER